MFTYIKHDVRGFYVELENELTPDLYSNLGTNWDDFIANKWIKLSDEQVAFRSEHPTAKVHEVWTMTMDPVHVRDINDAKNEKKAELDDYYNQHVGDFKYNDKAVWVEKIQRLAMKNEAEAAKNSGNAQFKVQDDLVLTVADAIKLFDSMSVRELECRAMVDSKKAEIDALEDMDAVDAVVVSDGFPTEFAINDTVLEKQAKEAVENDASLQVLSLMSMTINTMSLSDEDAYKVKKLYPQWETLIGQDLEVGTKLQYDGKLFKVIQKHTAQADWIPGTATASLYTEINESHAGTKEDPIPYNNNMELFEGKYYIQDGIIYKCTRDSQTPLYHPLSSLVGIYVEVATE